VDIHIPGKSFSETFAWNTVSTGWCYKLMRNVVTSQSDGNAARNVLARLHDQEIDRWTPWQKVKSILLKLPCATTVGTAQPGL
jgi:hypothetical protein